MSRDPFLNQSQDHGGPAMPSLKEGQWLFNRRYELVQKLGAGGMGVVWLARDHTEETLVALKFLPSVLVQHEAEMKRLKEEVRAGKELRHPGIVATYALELEDGTAAIVMEYVEGKTLAELLVEQQRGFFEPEEITAWARSIAEAIDYLHTKAKRIHRDLKPANILVDASGEARLMDFGISRRVAESVTRHSKTSEGHGDSSATLAYASPQQLAGKPAHPADDLYSLGALLYELLTGTPPFFRGDAALVAVQIATQPVTPLMERRAELVSEGANASTGQNVPVAVEKGIGACLEKEREKRPASAQKVYECLAAPEAAKSGPLSPLSGAGQSKPPAKTTPVPRSPRDASSTSPTASPRATLRGLSGLLWAAALIVLSLGAWAIFSKSQRAAQGSAANPSGMITPASGTKTETMPKNTDVQTSHDPLVIGLDATYPPFEFLDESGQITGISVEIGREISKTNGRKVEFRNINFDGLITALRNSSIDLVISSMTVSEDRRKLIDFSDPYVKTGLSILAAKEAPVLGVDDLKAPLAKIVVRLGTNGESWCRKNLPNAQINVHDADTACIMDLVNGKVDAWVHDQIPIMMYHSQYLDKTRALLDLVGVEFWGVGLRQQDAALKAQVDETLTRMRADGSFTRLAGKFMAKEQEMMRNQGLPFVFEIEASTAKAQPAFASIPMPASASPAALGGASALPANPLDNGSVGKQHEVTLPGGVKLSLCFCPAGSFTMGSPSTEDGHSDNEDQVQVTLTQPFWLARTELTQAQWVALMGSNPSSSKGDDLPVERVSPVDADASIVKLNEKVPLQGWKWVLPSEAQWEYACRAGSPGEWGWVKDKQMGTLEEMGWFEDNAGLTRHEVGTKKANAWGLCDMHGNVYECCRDLWDGSAKLPGGPNPLGTGFLRVVRGGSWLDVARGCRAAYRGTSNASGSSITLGFRPAAVPAGGN